MKTLHLIFATKITALAGIAGFMYANHQAKAEESATQAPETDKKADASATLPDVPEKGLSLSRAAEIRNQLLLMRKDVEQKTEKMNVARQGYERAKLDVEQKLKRIEEERKLLEETLQKERKAKDDRLTETLEFISKMEPKKAAPLIETMDRDLVMQLLRKLPPRQVTKLLESVNPKKATELLEYYTRIRSGREYEMLREMGLCANGNEEGMNEKSGSGSKSDVEDKFKNAEAGKSDGQTEPVAKTEAGKSDSKTEPIAKAEAGKSDSKTEATPPSGDSSSPSSTVR